VYAAVGFLLVPRVVRSQLLAFTTDSLKRTGTIGEIRFNPFTLTLEAHAFSLPDSDGTPLLGFSRLLLNLQVSSVWRGGASFAAVEIEQPFVRATQRRDGSFNLADLSRSTAAPAANPHEPLPSVFIDKLDIIDGRVAFEDRAREQPFAINLRPISFELRDFSTRSNGGNLYALQGASSAGEKFSWSGSFALAPLTSRGKFAVRNLRAATLSAYLADAVAFDFSNGLINLEGDYLFTSGDAGDLALNLRQVAVSDLKVRVKGRDSDYVEASKLDLADTRLSLRGRRVDVGRVLLEGGVVRASRDAEGRINLTEFARAAGQGAATGETAPQANSAWLLAAPDIDIRGLRVELDDQLVQPAAEFLIEPLELHVSNFSTAPDAQLAIDLRAQGEQIGDLTVKGKWSVDSGTLVSRVDLHGLNLATLQPYLATYTQTTLANGSLQAGLDVEKAASGALTIEGDVAIAKLRALDSALQQDLLKWDELKLGDIQYSSSPAKLRIARIVARSPYARVIIAPDQTLNITRLLRPAAGAAPAAVQTLRDAAGERHAPGGNPGAMAVSIGKVEVINGSANFADFWIKPNYAVSLQELSGDIVGMSSNPRSRARVDLQGKVDRYAPARIQGEINLLSAALYSDLKVKFDGVELTSVTPYSGRFAGYQIEKGKLSIDVAYHVEDRKLTATQKFVIDQLELGERVASPDAVHLPLKLAVALLKDRNGVIDIDLPLTGSLDDPKFRMGPLIWKAFLGMITKIATSPFALLGRLGGGGGDEQINQIDFDAGSTVLSAQAMERLKSLAKALGERPQLQLEVPAAYVPDLDARAMARQRIEDNLRAAGLSAAATDSERFDLLVRQFQKQFGARAPLPAITASAIELRKKKAPAAPYSAANNELMLVLGEEPRVTDSELEELARRRAQAVRDALLTSGEVDPTRVFMLAVKPGAVAEGHARLELSLK